MEQHQGSREREAADAHQSGEGAVGPDDREIDQSFFSDVETGWCL